jgi:hypothetical protein
MKIIYSVLLLSLIWVNPAKAFESKYGTTRFGINFGHAFETYNDFVYIDQSRIEDDFKTWDFNLTHFFKNGFNISVSTTRLINHKSKRLAFDKNFNEVFNLEVQTYIDTLLFGYKYKRVNTSLVIANVQSKSRAYNEFFDETSKVSSIVPAINISYFLTNFEVLNKNIDIVPSVSFYKSKELGIKQGMSANINFLF